MPDPLLPPDLRFGRALCGRLTEAERREWWLTNGRGGYAAGTVAGSLTRRYHGLLVAPWRPPLGRWLVFAKADATVWAGDRAWPLGTNRWTDGAVDPAGFRHLESFHLEGRLPVWRFARDGVTVEQRIWMEPGADRTYVAWRVVSSPGGPDHLLLEVDLLGSARDHHHVSAARGPDPLLRIQGTRLAVDYPDGPRALAVASAGEWAPEPVWVEGFDLPRERERGLEDRDNHQRLGRLRLPLVPGHWHGLALGLEDPGDPDLAASLERARARDRQVAAVPAATPQPGWVRRLMLAADDFLFRRPEGESVIAGYPWFGDWGRDTLIALPGLTLATGRTDCARQILETYTGFMADGLLPNTFPGSGETPAYNSADAALWFIAAWRAYWLASGDRAGLAHAFPVLAEIVSAYARGTRYGIGVDAADGLVHAGTEGAQLTWMDAKVGDWVVTPRRGKPVEVNALWVNALRTMADFADALGADPAPYRTRAAAAEAGFQRFVRADGQGLLDVLDGPEGSEDALRPNQILAVGLPHSALGPAQQAAVVSACARELLTSYGLRSLAPTHPDYRGRYGGGVAERDGAYHQGPVWAWLLGSYALAEYRVTGDAGAALGRLRPLGDHLADTGLGQVSELFDGDPPHEPRGAPAQAWSAACTLEAWWRLGGYLGGGNRP